jgi:hypothetical protein
MGTLHAAGRLGLVLHPRTSSPRRSAPRPIRARRAVRSCRRCSTRWSEIELSLLDLPFLPDEMRDVLPDRNAAALALDS